MNGKNVDLPLPRVPGMTESIPRDDKALEKQPDTLPLDIVTGQAKLKSAEVVKEEEAAARIEAARNLLGKVQVVTGGGDNVITPVDQRQAQLQEKRGKQS